ncbi:MAG: phosphatase PAP2 family protein [Deltaproteobacteria bacterium]|nr:phosphatase PAP2 family protein [Deltaproteobacteria bacterium]
MDTILKFDTNLFYIINTRLTSGVLDAYMPFVSDISNFYAVILLGALIMLASGWEKGLRNFIVLAIAIAASDLSGGLIKNLLMRVRPCHALQGVRLLSACGKAYSFPSGHAASIFAAMVFLTAKYRRFWPFFMFIALSVAYSRVYVGAHYPLDALGGATLGSGAAYLFFLADKTLVQRIINRAANRQEGH